MGPYSVKSPGGISPYTHSIKPIFEWFETSGQDIELAIEFDDAALAERYLRRHSVFADERGERLGVKLEAVHTLIKAISLAKMCQAVIHWTWIQ